jgi:hypothetical protein
MPYNLEHESTHCKKASCGEVCVPLIPPISGDCLDGVPQSRSGAASVFLVKMSVPIYRPVPDIGQNLSALESSSGLPLLSCRSGFPDGTRFLCPQ